jgi:pSer/pThr/pTyr-binding forkhead associated (FHA) protein
VGTARRVGFAVEARGHRYPIQLGKPLRVGREAHCEICLDAPAVSRIHAWFWLEGDEVYVEDLGSRNGMYVNGARVQGRLRINVGDRVVIGDRTLVLAEDDRELLETPMETPAVRVGDQQRATDKTTTVDQVFLDATREACRGQRFRDAADALQHFLHTIEALSAIAPVAPAVLDAAAPLVIETARGSGDARWIEKFLRTRKVLKLPASSDEKQLLDAAAAEITAARRKG